MENETAVLKALYSQYLTETIQLKEQLVAVRLELDALKAANEGDESAANQQAE